MIMSGAKTSENLRQKKIRKEPHPILFAPLHTNPFQNSPYVIIPVSVNWS